MFSFFSDRSAVNNADSPDSRERSSSSGKIEQGRERGCFSHRAHSSSRFLDLRRRQNITRRSISGTRTVGLHKQ